MGDVAGQLNKAIEKHDKYVSERRAEIEGKRERGVDERIIKSQLESLDNYDKEQKKQFEANTLQGKRNLYEQAVHSMGNNPLLQPGRTKMRDVEAAVGGQTRTDTRTLTQAGERAGDIVKLGTMTATTQGQRVGANTQVQSGGTDAKTAALMAKPININQAPGQDATSVAREINRQLSSSPQGR
jgi:hypothetical protein